MPADSERQRFQFDVRGVKLDMVDKRTIWEAIKEDEFLAEMAKQFKPVAIQHGNKKWVK